MTDPVDLIGKHIEESSVEAFLVSHCGPHTVDDFAEHPGVSRYATAASSGVDLSLSESGVIEVVFLHVNGHDLKPDFEGQLPLGLSRNMTQSDVRRLLGAPTFERSPLAHPPLGSYGPADRYDLATFSVHLEYSTQALTLALVTIMTASAVPGHGDGDRKATRH